VNIPVIPIGNSKGIRLSKTILEKYSIQDSLEIILEEDYIVLKPSTQAREGWDQAFKKMNEEGDDQLLLPDLFEDENLEEWK
jgi:antitoxin MazE